MERTTSIASDGGKKKEVREAKRAKADADGRKENIPFG